MTGSESEGPRLERSNRCYGGSVGVYAHGSSEIGGGMRFSIYLPPAADRGPVPALLYLAGLTCNEDTFMTKAGAIPHPAAAGLALVAPDTSRASAAIPATTPTGISASGALARRLP